ncbi:MAG TPA: PKD domain-containing protein, partial [Syntrophaceae bacterium]|nr:PKD domain-containing protein [Syntrophaceae bacterium]
AEQGEDTVSFTGHGTDTDGFVNAYNWRSSLDGQLSTASSFSKPASELSAGTHTIYFRVQDDDGAWSTEAAEDLKIIEQGNQYPVADPNGPYTGTEGIPVTFDGSGSYDPDGSIASYEWYFGDGNISTGVNPTHTYTQNGAYAVTLTVTDDNGATDANTTTATIADTEPTADFTATPTSGPEPLTVAFTDISTSYDGITAWEWDFDNDGETDSMEQNPAHVYAEDGVYTVTLTVYESDGDSDTETKPDYITVTNEIPPIITIQTPENKTYTSKIIPLNFTADKPLVTCLLSVDSTANQTLLNCQNLSVISREYQAAAGTAAWWHFNGDAIDYSGNGNHGTINGASFVDGKFGSALKFDGVDDYVEVGDSNSLNPKDEITIETWIKLDSKSAWDKIISKPCIASTPPYQQYALTLDSEGDNFGFELTTEGTKSVVESITSPLTGIWYHVVGVYNGSEMVIYVDGVKENTLNKTGAINSYNTDVSIGRYEHISSQTLNGVIDELR